MKRLSWEHHRISVFAPEMHKIGLAIFYVQLSIYVINHSESMLNDAQAASEPKLNVVQCTLGVQVQPKLMYPHDP